MIDWMTLCVEIAGIIIFCFWVYVPIQEFRDIYKRMHNRLTVVEEPPSGFDVIVNKEFSGDAKPKP
jgi:hypothetical protein